MPGWQREHVTRVKKPGGLGSAVAQSANVAQMTQCLTSDKQSTGPLAGAVFSFPLLIIRTHKNIPAVPEQYAGILNSASLC